MTQRRAAVRGSAACRGGAGELPRGDEIGTPATSGRATSYLMAFAALFIASALASGACGRTGPEIWDDGGYPLGGGGPGGQGAGGHGNGGHGLGGDGAGGLGGGGGAPCGLDPDCDDGDGCTTDHCDAGHCVHFQRDDDGDGHVAAACLGDDCNDLNPDAFPGHPEVCGDGSDNDCNGVSDCFDPQCVGVPDCGCHPAPGGENCTNGDDDDCDGAVDCLDADCAATPACGCAAHETGHCDDGLDNDCDTQFDCDDPDCLSAPKCQCHLTIEDCGNGLDEDCDLLVDCADPDCWGLFPCACIPPGFPEICNDGSDNDCDGDSDCADPDCILSPTCAHCVAENCSDGNDNNCNGAIDCADPECFFDPACQPTAEVCNNLLDDDHDGKADCQDPDCASNPLCVLAQANCLSPRLISSGTFFGDTTGHTDENHGSCGGGAGEAVFTFVLDAPSKVHADTIGTSFDSTIYLRKGSCDHGKELGCDDDSAGTQWAAALDFTILYPGVYYLFVDGYTIDPNFGPNEGLFQLNVTITPNPPELCHNGIDDDGDHYVDCADADCTSAPGCLACNGGQAPAPEFGIAACTDGVDNDCDGVSDCADVDCHASDYYVTECCNGADENGNQIVDDFACRCASDADCPGDEICYTHTVFACGFRCDQFFGQICPFVAPGSFCNGATGQCEF